MTDKIGIYIFFGSLTMISGIYIYIFIKKTNKIKKQKENKKNVNICEV